MKLFMVYLGGSASGANLELHDIRFVAGRDIRDTLEILRQQWFGELNGLHIDSYMQVQAIDGYDVVLKQHPQQLSQKLYFVNLGGYYPQQIAEQHAFMLCVAESAAAAKQKAKQQLLVNADKQHKDNLLELDNCFAVTQLQGWHIHLLPGTDSQPMHPDWSGYQRID